MTLDDRGRRAADDARAAAATTDFKALRARVGAEGYGNRGRGRRSVALVAAAVLLLVGLGVGVLLAGHLHLTTTQSASNASSGPPRKVGASADAMSRPGTTAATASSGATAALARSTDRLVARPSVGLVDGEEVQLRASGFAPGTIVEVFQCAAHPQPGSDSGAAACAQPFRRLRTPAVGGPVVVTFRVQRTFSTPFTRSVDCGGAPGACVIVMSGSSGTAPAESSVALTFAPVGTTTTSP